MKTAEPPRDCFSYIRFSSGKQAKGDSLERQLRIAPLVASKKRWNLREDLNATSLGLSAYKGSNLEKINEIIKAAELGKIPKGTVMILEALDRLTRLSLDDAYQLFRRVLLSGIEVYTNSSDRHMTAKDLNNPMSLMMTVVELDASFQHSDKLSNKVGSAWKAKRANLYNGVKLTKKVVGWIDGKTWKPIPARVKIVKRIFSLYLKGVGISSIVRQLNQDKVKTFGGKVSWNSSYISQILHSRAVLGEFQPHVTSDATTGNYYKRTKAGEVIKDYYPAIIDETIFYQVQSKLGDNKKAPKTNKIVNLFSGVAYCACGQKMYLAVSNKRGVSRKYYYCWGKIKGLGCDTPTCPYEHLEHYFLKLVMENAHKIYADDDSLAETIQAKRGKLIELESQIDRITTAFFEAGSKPSALVKKQSELEDLSEKLTEEIAILQSKLTTKGKTTVEEMMNVTIGQLRDSPAVRQMVRDFILEHVARVTFSKDRQEILFEYKSELVTAMSAASGLKSESLTEKKALERFGVNIS